MYFIPCEIELVDKIISHINEQIKWNKKTDKKGYLPLGHIDWPLKVFDMDWDVFTTSVYTYLVCWSQQCNYHQLLKEGDYLVFVEITCPQVKHLFLLIWFVICFPHTDSLERYHFFSTMQDCVDLNDFGCGHQE